MRGLINGIFSVSVDQLIQVAGVPIIGPLIADSADENFDLVAGDSHGTSEECNALLATGEAHESKTASF
jgi:hypothetical protein